MYGYPYRKRTIILTNGTGQRWTVLGNHDCEASDGKRHTNWAQDAGMYRGEGFTKEELYAMPPCSVRGRLPPSRVRYNNISQADCIGMRRLLKLLKEASDDGRNKSRKGSVRPLSCICIHRKKRTLSPKCHSAVFREQDLHNIRRPMLPYK